MFELNGASPSRSRQHIGNDEMSDQKNTPYEFWEQSFAEREYRDKHVGSFFRSETHFLEQIVPDIKSVLDIGCAYGRFYDLIKSIGGECSFSGIDIVKKHVDVAQSKYPKAHFFYGNALDISLDQSFDLVNATGVFQHDRRFESLLDRMVAWSNQYVMFDVKFADISDHIVDPDECRAVEDGVGIEYILLNAAKFITRLKQIKCLGRIEVFGYETGNTAEALPKGVTKIVSAGVLLEKGEGPLRCDIDLPAWLEMP